MSFFMGVGNSVARTLVGFAYLELEFVESPTECEGASCGRDRTIAFGASHHKRVTGIDRVPHSDYTCRS